MEDQVKAIKLRKVNSIGNEMGWVAASAKAVAVDHSRLTGHEMDAAGGGGCPARHTTHPPDRRPLIHGFLHFYLLGIRSFEALM